MKKYNYIYIITNTLDGKIYIGQHTSNKLNDNYFGSGLRIKRAIKKYGKENFTKEILAYTDTQESLNWLEKYYIRKYKAQNPEIGYNIAFGGVYGNTYIRTPESIAKFKRTIKERYNNFSGENNPMFHHQWTDEQREKQRIAQKGLHVGEKNVMYGNHHSEESKRKESETKRGSHRVYDNPEHTKWHMEK